MNKTDSIAKLAAALVKAQKDIEPIAKDSVNPHFRNKYASLDGMIENVRPILASHGLAIVQGATQPIVDSEGALAGFAVETMLVHESGEWLANSAIMPLVKVDAQGVGGAMTYGRRYGLSAILSLSTDDDDDGHSAGQAQPRTASAPRSATNGEHAPASNGATKDVKIMPFGKTKGKALVDLPKEELQKTLKWCQDTDAEKFKDLIASIRRVLNDKALGVRVPDDGENFPDALRDEPDNLPF